MFKLNHAITAVVILNSFSCSSNEGPDKKVSAEESVIELFNGKSLGLWQEIQFGEENDTKVSIENGKMLFDRGDPLTGIVLNDSAFDLPNDEYEIILKARKIEGRDFFCALTFPVPEKKSCCTFVAGGWGGQVTGLSNIDYLDANRNTTRSTLNYDHDRWYLIKVEVTNGRIRCWIDEKLVVNCLIGDKHISMRSGSIEKCQPFGIASYETKVEFESISLRKLSVNH
jgi:hypothetical protein